MTTDLAINASSVTAPNTYSRRRETVVTAVPSLSARTVVVPNSLPGRYTVERWVTTHGKNARSMGQTGHASQARAEKAAAEWLASVVAS